jgi:transposase-like protein
MIDPETKKKIVELYTEGETKSSISKKMNVSLPTIRDILREAKQGNIEEKDNLPRSDIESRLSALEKRVNDQKYDVNTSCDATENWRDLADVFTLNLSSPYPFEDVPLYTRLRKGMALWWFPDALKELFPISIINDIMEWSEENR